MSSDPPRMREDPEVPEDVRRLLERADAAPLPGLDVEAGVRRLRVAVYAGMGLPIPGSGAPPGGGPPGGGTAGASGAAGAGAAGTSAAGGGMLGAIAVGVVLGTIVAVPIVTSGPHNTEIVAERESNSTPGPVTIVQPTAVATAAVENAAVPEVAVEAGAAPGRASADTSDDPAAMEINHMRLVHAAPPERRLALVEEGHRRFARGSFYSEREYEAVTALVELGRLEEARARAQAFLDGRPTGLYADKMRRFLTPPGDDGGAGR